MGGAPLAVSTVVTGRYTRGTTCTPASHEAVTAGKGIARRGRGDSRSGQCAGALASPVGHTVSGANGKPGGGSVCGAEPHGGRRGASAWSEGEAGARGRTTLAPALHLPSIPLG